jgi:hypothetical protein
VGIFARKAGQNEADTAFRPVFVVVYPDSVGKDGKTRRWHEEYGADPARGDDSIFKGVEVRRFQLPKGEDKQANSIAGGEPGG